MLNIDLRQTKKHARFMEKLGWLIYEVPIPGLTETNKIFIWRISRTPFSLIRAYRVKEPIPFQTLEWLEKKYHAVSIRLEPYLLAPNTEKRYRNLFNKHEYQKDTWCHFPSKTIKIDLTKELDLIIKRMNKKTLYNIKLSQRRKVKVSTHTGTSLLKHKDVLCAYSHLLNSNAQRLGITGYPYMWLQVLVGVFKEDLILCLAFLNKKLIAGSLFISNKYGLYYIQNCSTEAGKKNDASSLLIFQAIQEGKQRNLAFLDLEGIYDERYAVETKSWKGFTNFKLGFGGNVEEYIGSYTKNNFNLLKKISKFQVKLFSPKYLPSLYPEETYKFTPFELKLRKLFKIKDI